MRAKRVIFMGGSREDLRRFPKDARAVTGQALYHAQLGSKHVDAKPLKGFHGAAVMEIVADAKGDAYRAVYAVQLADFVYVLHCFQKKSKRGAKPPQHHLEMIRRRLRKWPRKIMRKGRKKQPPKAIPGSDNIFADLNLSNPDEWLAKAELARRISDLIDSRGLSQRQAAALLGVKQPQVSAVMRGLLQGFTTDRLFRFLNKLGQEIKIVVHPAAKTKKRGSISVEAA